jgi:hypothetical protein
VGRDASRVDAMHTTRSITSTVPYGGLSTSTIGACGREARTTMLTELPPTKLPFRNGPSGGFGPTFCSVPKCIVLPIRRDLTLPAHQR